MSNQRFITLAFLVAAVLAGMLVRSASVSVLTAMGNPDTLLAGVVPLSSMVGLAGGAITMVVLMRHPVAVQFTDQVVSELVKVSWPSRDETVRSTSVVVVATLVIATSLAVFDLFWSRVTALILFSGS